MTSNHPNYLRVFATFARNSLVRDMTFRTNFIIECVTSTAWVLMMLGFYIIIFSYTPSIGANTGWGKYQFYVFLSTTMLVNSLVQTFFMPNADEFSELIRTGKLDFALLKPIDTQFLISLNKLNWASLVNGSLAMVLMGYALVQMHRQEGYVPHPAQVALFAVYLLCGVAILYSLMISMASMSVWMGRNQSLYEFWFYITNFSRYPMEIYRGWPVGDSLKLAFTFVVPVLIVVNVPARLMAKPLAAQEWPLVVFALVATVLSLAVSRWIFTHALGAYRSASS